MGHTHTKGNAISRKELIRKVENAGWVRLNKGHSGHTQFVHPTYAGKVTIPSKITKNIELSVLSQARLRRNIYDEVGK